MFDFADLFSGIGGVRLPLEELGFRCVWSCDRDRYANQIYRHHWGTENHHTGDVEGVDPERLPHLDLLCAGFPCQPFSTQGRRRGLKDPDGTAFGQVLRIAEAKRPGLLLLENVKGLLSHDGGRTFATMLAWLQELGYWWEYRVFDCQHFGPPQSRLRVFVVGHLAGSRGDTKPILLEKIEPEELPKEGLEEEEGAGPVLLHRPVLPTITASYGNLTNSGETYIWEDHGGARHLTPLELERAQGFPDNWTRYGLTLKGETVEMSRRQRYKKIGNAVPPPVIRYIGQLILNAGRTQP